jgi:hypothetical protein
MPETTPAQVLPGSRGTVPLNGATLPPIPPCLSEWPNSASTRGRVLAEFNPLCPKSNLEVSYLTFPLHHSDIGLGQFVPCYLQRLFFVNWSCK